MNLVKYFNVVGGGVGILFNGVYYLFEDFGGLMLYKFFWETY